MRRLLGCLLALALAGCGGDDTEHGGQDRPEAGGTPPPEVTPR